MALLIRVTHKPTGERFWFSKRNAWGKAYYSADREETWHPTKSAAYTSALAAGKLEQINQPKETTP